LSTKNKRQLRRHAPIRRSINTSTTPRTSRGYSSDSNAENNGDEEDVDGQRKNHKKHRRKHSEIDVKRKKRKMSDS
jgi:hypothetical protein